MVSVDPPPPPPGLMGLLTNLYVRKLIANSLGVVPNRFVKSTVGQLRLIRYSLCIKYNEMIIHFKGTVGEEKFFFYNVKAYAKNSKSLKLHHFSKRVHPEI